MSYGREGCCAWEDHPAQHHRQQRIKMPQRARQFFQCGSPARPFQHQKNAVIKSPHHKCPARPVPQAAQEKHSDEVETVAGFGNAVAAERNIKIVAKPARQRDVPAPPEIPDGLRGVGKIEIFDEREAEHFAQPDRHVRVAGEIEIDLQRVATDAEPRRGR